VTSDRPFFGHPRGLAILAGTQLWERFSFYGMQTLLTLYLVNHLLKPGRIEGVWGFAAFRAGLEAITGPLGTLALAAQIFGLYIGLFNIVPLLGAWAGDGPLGQRRTVVVGLILMAAGHLAMVSEALFLIALALLVLGGGLLKGNLYAQVGQLYQGDDPANDQARPRAYALFLLVLNIGAFAAPLVCGTLGELYGWHWGFGAAGIGMLIGLIIYLAGAGWLPPDVRRERASGLRAAGDTRRIVAILAVLLPYTIIFAGAMQAYNLLLVWAERAMDRTVLGQTMPVTWLLSIDGAGTIAGIMVMLWVWRWLAARGLEPDALGKIAISGALVSAAWSLLAVATSLMPLVPLLVVAAFFLVLDLSFGWLEAPANGFAAATAPPRLLTTMISLNIMAFGLANIISGWLGRYYEPLGPAGFWWLNAGFGAAGAVLALALRPLVRRLLLALAPGALAAA
jgi:POT family proton-dependent oligopeptide transporter